MTDRIIVLNASVSVSTSSEKPVAGTGWSKSREAVISDSDVDSVSIGREIVRASHTLREGRERERSDRDEEHGAAVPSACGTLVDAPIESSAYTCASPSWNRSLTAYSDVRQDEIRSPRQVRSDCRRERLDEIGGERCSQPLDRPRR